MPLRELIWHRFLGRPHKLAVVVEGEGEPLLLVHGIGANGTVWQPLIDRLRAQQYKVIAPDLLGFGASPKPGWKDYTVDDHAQAVIAALNKLGVRQPIVIVGHSMGGLVAIRLATKYPKRVKRLVLYAPSLFAEDPLFKRHTRGRARHFSFFNYIAAHPEFTFMQQRWLWRVMHRLSGIDLTEERWLPFERSLRNTIMGQQAYNELLTLRVPIDVIYGRLDFIVVRAQINKMLKANSHITLHTITSTHSLLSAAARAIAKILA